jgi:formylglycine-generating enzyme required for sulfatase activity
MKREIIGKDGAPMMLVPAGEFTMGSNTGHSEEKPVHHVYVDAFYMDQYEVTVTLYAKFLNATGRYQPTLYGFQAALASQGDRPVIGVTWHDAVAYCQWAGKRLPTEAEWEKAARGTDRREYPWGNEAPSSDRGNYGQYPMPNINPYADRLKPVGSYGNGKSPYGIYDMAGNVWEWVADWYGDYSVNPERNPKGPPSKEMAIHPYKVLRGGSWYIDPSDLRSAHRHADLPSHPNAINGFRCAQDAPN